MNRFTEKQIKALWVSAEHHLELYQEPYMGKLGPGHCKCCNFWWYGGCIGCPIYQYTGQPDCRGTPYDDIDLYADAGNIPMLQEAEEKEFTFLVTLALLQREE